jgi:hypothetical protein
VWPVFHSCPSLFRNLFIVERDFHLSIIPVYVLCLSQCNPHRCTSSFFSPILCCSSVFSVFLVSCFYTDVMYFIIHCRSFLLFLLPCSPLPVPLFGYMFCIYLYVYIILLSPHYWQLPWRTRNA